MSTVIDFSLYAQLLTAISSSIGRIANEVGHVNGELASLQSPSGGNALMAIRSAHGHWLSAITQLLEALNELRHSVASDLRDIAAVDHSASAAFGEPR